MATPSEILRKTKKPAAATEEKSEDKKGEKQERKGNALIDFIAKNKKPSKD